MSKINNTIVVMLMMTIFVFMGGCEPESSPKFAIGEIVVTRIGNLEGQIIDYRFVGKYRYRVRVHQPMLTTNTRLLHSDESIDFKALSIINMYEYELAKKDSK